MRLGMLRLPDGLQPALVVGDHAYALNEIATLTHVPLPVTLPGGAAALLATSASTATMARLMDAAVELIQRGELTAHALKALGPPVPRPGKIICVGRNYAAHAEELGNEAPANPILFSKFATAIVGPFDVVVRPLEVRDLDYEAELCVVIGAGGRRIPAEEALQAVAGYCCANDVSARTAQLHSDDQWLRGKSFDTFCPLGPAIVSRDEVPDPQELRITCRVDGETRQDASTAEMIVGVAGLVSYASNAFTLEAGDLILTGTPAGVAMGRTPPPWLQPGQVAEVEIERIGRIANTIVDEPEPPARLRAG